jgi:hypothetical protein
LYVQNQNELKKAFNQVQASSISGAAPIGSVTMWAGTSANAPSTYAVCNGASLSTTGTYAALFAVIGYRYGGSGATFNLPDFTSNVPVGITGVPVVPSTKITSAASAVDAHTHTVNSALTGANSNIGINSGNSNIGINTGNVSTHTHAGGLISGANSNIGNTQAHTHGVVGNTGGQSANHTHGTTGSDSPGHTHTYFRPNSGANNSTGGVSANHTHATGSQTVDHSHGILFNSGNANATGINGSNSSIGITQIGAPNLYPFFPGVTGIDIVLTGSNSSISLTGANSNIGLTAGNASTINASTPAHTHTTATTQIIFIIRVS